MALPSQEQFHHLEERERVLETPDYFVGPTDRVEREVFAYDVEKKEMRQIVTLQAEAQEQTFLEILGNATDNVQDSRDAGYDPIRIEVTITDTTVMVTNYGMWIPVEEKEGEGMMVPELIFGVMGTGSKYRTRKKKKQFSIGKNGIGAKATNIFSKEFQILCNDPHNGLIYSQKWEDNMLKRYEPVIQESPEGWKECGLTQVQYTLDFKRFGVEKFSEEDKQIYAAHCVAGSLLCKIPIIFNEVPIEVASIKEYAGLFVGEDTKKLAYSDPEGVYEVCYCDTKDDTFHISFVNGLHTPMGGVHLDAAAKAILKGASQFMKNKSGVRFTKADVLPHVSIVVSCKLYEPSFRSQAKKYLAGPGFGIELPDKVLKKLKGWDLIDRLNNVVKQKQLNKHKKSDAKNTKKRVKIPKGKDANKAGKDPKNCRLLLVEGDSASQYALKFASLIRNDIGESVGLDYYGIMPLKGKPLNAYNADFERLLNNKEFSEIKKVLGLREQVDYSQDHNFGKLRYSQVWIMVDADVDGKHIAGLLLLFFMCRFPQLVERGMIFLYRTPVVRVSRGGESLKFYTEKSYKEWEAMTPDNDKWTHEYFKGLGSSEPHHIEDDFHNIRLVRFIKDQEAMNTLIKVFDSDKEQSDRRKEWLSSFVEEELENTENLVNMSITSFVDNELILFSMASNIRAIPQLDGFKESTRKLFYTVSGMLKGKKEKVKVAQAASRAADVCMYKHGEANLVKTLSSLAANYVGSNNEPIFAARGLFGSRDNPKAAEGRYIYVSESWWTKYIFRKEDEQLLKRLYDEGQLIEYERYYPILPTLFFNITSGTGTGYKTQIPSFYPPQLALWIKQRIARMKYLVEQGAPRFPGEDEEIKIDGDLCELFPLPELVPWFRDHNGPVRRRVTAEGKVYGFASEGVFEFNDKGDIVITELPIQLWTSKYKAFLENLDDSKIIKSFSDHSTDNTVKFTLHGWDEEGCMKLPDGKLSSPIGPPSLNSLKLIKKFNTCNMTILLPQEDGSLAPQIFTDPSDIMEIFFRERYDKYVLRKEMMIEDYQRKVEYTTERMRFIQEVLDKVLVINRRKAADIRQEMTQSGYKSTDHLDKTRAVHFTKEELEKLAVKIEKMRGDLEALKVIPPEDLWIHEIDEYLHEYSRENGGIEYPEYS